MDQNFHSLSLIAGGIAEKPSVVAGSSYFRSWQFQWVLTLLVSSGILAVFVLVGRTSCQLMTVKYYSSYR